MLDEEKGKSEESKKAEDTGDAGAAKAEDLQAKIDAGETLTEEEQAIIDAAAAGDEGGDAEDGKSGSEEGTGDKGDELSPEEQELLKAAMPKVQKRFDDQTSKIKQLESELEKLKAPDAGNGKKERSISEYTEDELWQLEAEHPEYRKYVQKELIKREVDARDKDRSTKSEIQKAAAENETAALTKYPDLADSESALFKLAKTIYDKNGYGRITDGTMIAADRAAEILRKQKKAVKTTDKKRDSDIKKFGMSGASKGHSVGGTSNKRLEELEKAAEGTAPGSMEWRNVIKEQRRLKELKDKAKKE